MPIPEQLIGIHIDVFLSTTGRLVQDRAQQNLSAGRGIETSFANALDPAPLPLHLSHYLPAR